MIRFDCPFCSATLKAPEKAASKTITCPRCTARISVPQPSPTPTSAGSDVATPPGEAEAATPTLPPQPSERATTIDAETRAPESGQPNQEASTIEVPGYEILDELGRGGMGVVYKAKHLALERTVALKMILSGAHASEAELARFQTEAKAVARLQHPNIVQIFEVGEVSGRPFCALEFCPGGSLERSPQTETLSVEETVALVEKIARGVDAAHRKDVIHRDLKPANILLDENGTPKITDFGLSKAMDQQGQTQSGSVMGTPTYMAPEQARGKTSQIGPACDIYALGAILYDWLAGRPPFQGESVMDTIVQVMTEEPEPLRSFRPDVPGELEAICMRCLEKAPEDRYPTAGALADALAGHLGSTVKRPAPRPRADKPRPRTDTPQSVDEVTEILDRSDPRPDKPWAWVVGFGGVLLLACSVWVAWWMFGGEVRPTPQGGGPRGKGPTPKLPGPPGLPFPPQFPPPKPPIPPVGELPDRRIIAKLKIPDRGALDIAISPDGKYLAAACSDYKVRLYSLPKGEELFALEHQKDAKFNTQVTCVAFSPDGTKLATGSGDKLVKVWKVPSGEELFQLELHSALHALAWSPDGKHLATSTSVAIFVWEFETKKKLIQLAGHRSWVVDLVFSPDGNTLVTGSSDFTVWVRDWRTGRERFPALKHDQNVKSVAPNSKWTKLVSCGTDNTVRYWDARTGVSELVVKDKEQSITAVAVSPDDKWVAGGCGGPDKPSVIRLRPWMSEKVTLELREHTNYITDLAFTPAGDILVSAGWDGTIVLWNMKRVFAESQ